MKCSALLCRSQADEGIGNFSSRPLGVFVHHNFCSVDRQLVTRSYSSAFVRGMSPAKIGTSHPKGWLDTVTYLHAPCHSKTLKADKANILTSSKADLPCDVHVYRSNGPHSNVKITQITDDAHPAHGQYGLYANQLLLPDTFILPYLGYVHDQTDLDETSDYDLSLDRELGIGVDATRFGNEARFINDYRGVSTAPNAEFRDAFVDIGKGKVEKCVGVFVLSAGKSGKRAKGVGRGQEILVSYGKGFWTERQAAEVASS